MGKVDLTPAQKIVFESLAESEVLKNSFYLTGGTALSVFYLQHRLSDDLDFFSPREISDELITQFMSEISSRLRLKHRFTRVEDVRIFEFQEKNKTLLKIDFAHYPHPRLEEGKASRGVAIDSLLDIAANKLISIGHRQEVKDFVDLYFLLRKYTTWDLMYAVEAKFKRKIDLLLLSADFLAVEDFDYLPKMVKPLKIEDLRAFFRKKARQLGRTAVE